MLAMQRRKHTCSLTPFPPTHARTHTHTLSPLWFVFVLDARSGGGVYDIPGYGPLKYAGLAGVVPLLEQVVARNELGHPLCSNVRDGDWLLSYLADHMNRCVAVALSQPRDVGAHAQTRETHTRSHADNHPGNHSRTYVHVPFAGIFFCLVVVRFQPRRNGVSGKVSSERSWTLQAHSQERKTKHVCTGTLEAHLVLSFFNASVTLEHQAHPEAAGLCSVCLLVRWFVGLFVLFVLFVGSFVFWSFIVPFYFELFFWHRLCPRCFMQ